jgi:hypothetical protein
LEAIQAKLQPRRQAKEPPAKDNLGGKILPRTLQGLSRSWNHSTRPVVFAQSAFNQFPVVNSKLCSFFQFPLLEQITSVGQKYLDFSILG